MKEPFVDADDVGDAAITALTQSGPNGKLYELTGPELLIFAEAVKKLLMYLDEKFNFSSPCGFFHIRAVQTFW